MTRRLAVIPARGGSKRLPRKNILPFEGKPIIAYTIAAALETGMFDRVVVSTEDPEIAGVGGHYGADVDMRPQQLATDSATVVEVCEELLAREKAAGREYDVLCCLYATAPLRRAEDIAATGRLIDPGRCNFAMAVTRFLHYPQQALRRTGDSFLSPMWPALASQRADSVGDLVAGNGSTYCANVASFLEARTFYGPGLRGHEMPLTRSVDIDTRDDFNMALALFRFAAAEASHKHP